MTMTRAAGACEREVCSQCGRPRAGFDSLHEVAECIREILGRPSPPSLDRDDPEYMAEWDRRRGIEYQTAFEVLAAQLDGLCVDCALAARRA